MKVNKIDPVVYIYKDSRRRKVLDRQNNAPKKRRKTNFESYFPSENKLDLKA